MCFFMHKTSFVLIITKIFQDFRLFSELPSTFASRTAHGRQDRPEASGWMNINH